MSTATQASHEIVEDGDKVVVRDVELFCSCDSEIDEGGSDAKCKALRPEDVKGIVDRTSAYMRRGQFPRLVVQHDKGDGTTDPGCVGRIPAIRFERRGDVGYIVGDMEMSRADFDAYLRSNRFPRRSPEVWKDGYMSEVALLGRDTPRRPIEDTHFGREGAPEYARRPGAVRRFEMGTGGGPNTFVPGMPGKERDMQAELDKLREEYAALKASHAKLEAQLADTKAKHERTVEEKDTFARETATALQTEIAALRTQVKRSQFERQLDAMEKEGYAAVKGNREKLLAALDASPDPAATIGLWRETFAKSPIGIRLPGKDTFDAAAVASGGEPDPERIAAIVARAQQECEGDSTKYRQLVEKYSRTA